MVFLAALQRSRICFEIVFEFDQPTIPEFKKERKYRMCISKKTLMRLHKRFRQIVKNLPDIIYIPLIYIKTNTLNALRIHCQAKFCVQKSRFWDASMLMVKYIDRNALNSFMYILCTYIRWFRIFQTSRYQGIVKATVSGVLEDLTFKIPWYYLEV